MPTYDPTEYQTPANATNFQLTPDGLYVTGVDGGRVVRIANEGTTWYEVPTLTATNDISMQMQSQIYSLKEELANMEKRLYEIISSHTSIDISEEEFMRLLKENN